MIKYVSLLFQRFRPLFLRYFQMFDSRNCTFKWIVRMQAMLVRQRVTLVVLKLYTQMHVLLNLWGRVMN